MSLFLSCIFYSMVKIRKNMLQKEIKDWTYKAYLLTEETSSWFPLIESLKITCIKSYAWSLKFYQTERAWIFCGMSYPNWVKHLQPVHSQYKTNRNSFDFPKVSKMNISFELLKVSKMTNLKSLYLQSLRS